MFKRDYLKKKVDTIYHNIITKNWNFVESTQIVLNGLSQLRSSNPVTCGVPQGLIQDHHYFSYKLMISHIVLIIVLSREC